MLKLLKLDRSKNTSQNHGGGKTSFRSMRAALHADLLRLHNTSPQPLNFSRLRKLSLCFRPEIFTLLMFRFSHLCYANHWFGIAQFFYRLNIFITGADIHPRSEIGKGCLIVHTIGLVIDGNLGSETTIFGHCVIQANYEKGSWTKTPTIGNRCVLGVQCSVLGNVSIADEVTLAPFTLVMQSICEQGVTISAEHLQKIKIYPRKR